MEESLFNRFLRLLAAVIFASLAAAPALASNTFQYTCSEIRFAYQGNAPSLQAVCLRADGTPNATSLILQGISNQNGRLTRETGRSTYDNGRSTFQQSCGNIQILVGNAPNVTLSAFCRTNSGMSEATSLPLDNIANNNGNLVQQ